MMREVLNRWSEWVPLAGAARDKHLHPTLACIAFHASGTGGGINSQWTCATAEATSASPMNPAGSRGSRSADAEPSNYLRPIPRHHQDRPH